MNDVSNYLLFSINNCLFSNGIVTMTLEFKNTNNELISVHYEAVLDWFCCIHEEDGTINEDVKNELQDFINELTNFKPLVPIEDYLCQFSFIVEETRDVIHVETTVQMRVEQFNSKSNDFYYDKIIVGRIKDLCFIINIAYPGLLHITNGSICRDGVLLNKHFKYSSDLLELSNQTLVWPIIEQLRIDECWTWVVEKTNFLKDISNSPIDRALHALSYSDADENTYIFYVLLGIEALYNNGSTKEDSIIEQLKRKTRALLGEYPINKEKYIKKQINEMYRMRSLLVHGNTNIEKAWYTYDSTDDEIKTFFEQRNPLDLATAILLSTIQKFIKSNANTISETIEVRLE